MAVDLVYLFWSTMSDIITMVTTVVGFLHVTKKRRTNATAYLALPLGLTVVLLTLFPHPCQGQGHGQGHRRGQGYRYEYNRPRHIPREEGTGMAFLMDNWLFGRPPAPISSTTAEAHRRHWTHIPPTSQEYEIHENPLLYPAEKEDGLGSDEDEVVTRTYIETNWNEPVSLYSREFLTSQEATKSTFTSPTEGKSISSSANSPSIVARELPTSTENNNFPVSPQRTTATQTLPTTSGEQQGSSPTEAEGPEVKHNRNRNRISLTGRGQEVQDDDEKDSEDDDIDDDKKSTTTTTPKKEVKTTTEASKPPEKPEEKKKKPTDGDLKLEGGDVEGTGNVIIYKYVTSLFLIRGLTRQTVFRLIGEYSISPRNSMAFKIQMSIIFYRLFNRKNTFLMAYFSTEPICFTISCQ